MGIESKGRKWIARVYWDSEHITVAVCGSREAAQLAHDKAMRELESGISPHWVKGTASYAKFAAIIGVRVGTIKRWVHEGMPVDETSMRPRVVVKDARSWIEQHRSKSVAFDRTAVVYVIKRDDGAIKVGWTSDVARRIREIQKDSRGTPCKLIACIPGDKPAELRVHSALESKRIEGEWYNASVSEAVDALRAA